MSIDKEVTITIGDHPSDLDAVHVEINFDLMGGKENRVTEERIQLMMEGLEGVFRKHFLT